MLKCKPYLLVLTLIGYASAQLNVEYVGLFSNVLSELWREGQAQYDKETAGDAKVLLPEYDFIIVGAGSAGAVLANRLTENPKWNVLLIEAGPSENYFMDIPMFVHYLQAFNVNWDYKTKPSNTSCLGMRNNQCRWPRGKVMGGSSVLNFMIYTRGNARDYDRWAELGNAGWSWDEVQPYFQKMENCQVPDRARGYMGEKGPMPICYTNWKSSLAKAFVAANVENGANYVDYNGARQCGVSYFQTTTEDGMRKSSNAAYLYPIKGRKNLHIQKEAMVTKVLIEKGTNRARGVQFRKNGRYVNVMARKEVIVSAGAINSPQLLMLSGIGPSEHLRSLNIDPLVDLKVGYNLMDHTATALTISVNKTSMSLDRVGSPANILKFVKERKGPITSIGSCEAVAFYDHDNPTSEGAWPTVELFQTGGPLYGDGIQKDNFNLRPSFFNKVYGAALRNKQDAFHVWPMILRPKSRGRISLRTANPFEHPIIDTNYFSHPDDIKVGVKGIRRTLELLEQPSLRRVGARLQDTPIPGCTHLTLHSDEYFECFIRHITLTIYHYCGTCKMGPPSDPEAVVDERLRVYGIKGLRVVDASIMPEIPAGHTNGPTMMIAEKAADLIKSDWGGI